METNTNTNNCNKCNIKWKNDISSVKIALIPANSRPLLQPRFWHAKNRPMPELLTNENDNTLEIINAQYSLIQSTNVNNEDYLQYNNPDVKLNSDGAIVCDNEDGVFHNNMYSGPGWKKSRTHPNTRTALSRPIKHWRKQLFPRQFNINEESYDVTDSTKTTSRGRRNSGGLFDKPNGYFITDKIVSKEISCLPIYINTTKDDLNSCLQLDIINYGKIINCSIKTALFKSRPGSYTSNSIYQFKSNKAYLQARSKLYEQLASVNNSTTPNSSFYLNFNRNSNCKTVPSIVVNNNHYPISSRTNMRRKSKNAIIQNQYNITNTYGITTANIKVLPPPTAKLTATAYTITEGESVTLIPIFTNLFGGNAFLNDKPIALGISYTITPPDGIYIYTLRVINGAGISVDSSITITVVPAPTGTFSLTSGVSTITITAGESVTLRSEFTGGTATINDLSTFNNSAVTNNATYTISPSVGTNTYTLRVTNVIGFAVNSSVTITVLPAPTATFSNTSGVSTISITSGQSVPLRSLFSFGTATGTATIDGYPTFNNVAVTNNGTYTISPPVGTNTYTLRVTNSLNYAVNSIVTITVLPAPTGTLTLTSSSSTITIGESVTLKSEFTEGTAHLLNDSGSMIYSNIQLGLTNFSPFFTTVYKLIVTNSINFSVYSNTITITVLPAPTATFSNTSGISTIDITSGESVPLRSLFSFGTATGTATIDGYPTFNNVAVTNNGTYTISPPVGTNTYTLRVTNSLNYAVNSIVTITVLPLPTATLTSNIYTITSGQGQQVILRTEYTNGIQAYLDNISDFYPDVTISNGATYTIQPSVTTIYTLRVINSIGYTVYSSITITVVPAPTGTLDLTSGSSTITASESVTMQGTFANGTADIIRVSTSNNSEFISTVHSNIISLNNYYITPDVTSAYILRVTNSANYSIYSSTITITVLPLPTASLSITSGPSTITSGQGEQVTLTSSFTNGVQANLLRASDSLLLISNFVSSSLSPTVTTGYKLRVTNSQGFVVDSSIVTITVVPTPTGTLDLISGSSTITASESVIVRGTFANGTADIIRVSTSNNSEFISTVHSNIINLNNYYITPDVTSAYRLIVTNSANYSIYSSTITITVLPAPTATLSITSGSSTITNGQSVTLTSLVNFGTANGTATIDGDSTFNGTQVTNNATYTIIPPATTTYTLRVTNSAGFLVVSGVTITVTQANSGGGGGGGGGGILTGSLESNMNNVAPNTMVTLTATFSNGTANLLQDGSSITVLQSNITSGTTYSINIFSTSFFKLRVTYNGVETDFELTVYVDSGYG